MVFRSNKSLKSHLIAITTRLEAGINAFLSVRQAQTPDVMFELMQLIAQHNKIRYAIEVIKSTGLRWSLLPFLKPKRKYAPQFDERIYTEKLLGKPSPGLPPPFIFS